MKSALPFVLLALMGTTGHAADNCEPLRLRIEANIAAKGLADFTVSTVDAVAPVAGQVVGSCDNGSKKIVYSRGSGPAPGGAIQSANATGTKANAAAPAAAATAAVPAPRPVANAKPDRKATRDEDILTECKDGSVSMGGRCKD